MVTRLRAASDTSRTAGAALRGWTRRQALVAVGASLGVALLIGLSTVLIPNPVFGREIASVWWNYPVWLLGSVLAGMLVATYVRSGEDRADRPGKAGVAGGILTWFAVGCPVCNKIALLALGYTGALQWFAPMQPVLAVLAIALTGYALVQRLANQVSCALPA